MAKDPTKTKSAKINGGSGVRGRDAEFPSAPTRVSEPAQAKIINIAAAREFDFARRDRSKLPERPSTSGGPATNFSMRKSAERRETRDDLHFNPLAAHGKGTTFYNFPLPGSLPTPIQTPKSSPPLPNKSYVTRSDSPDSLDSRPAMLSVQQTEIGMALGSPTHQPTSWQPSPYFESSNRSPSPDMEASLDGWVDPPIPLKNKASKWKILGGLFGGGKKQSSPQTFYQLQPESTHQATVTANLGAFGEPPTSEKRPSKPRVRGRTSSERKTATPKPDVKRAATAPLNFDFQSNGGRILTATPEITIDKPVDNADQHHNTYSGGSMLDVDIPTTQMERYSIMFGSVLQKPVNVTSSSSLLARRQATLDRLKTVNEALAQKERELEEKAKLLRPRRATSPQPTRSPAFSLFPQTPSRLGVRDASPSPLGLQRSNTSPAALSPSRPSFEPQADEEMSATLAGPAPHIPINPRPRDESTTRARHGVKESDGPSRQTINTSTKPKWSTEESHLTLSPASDSEHEEDVYDAAPIYRKPKLEEPHWQMITPRSHQAPPSVSGSNSSRSEGHSASTSASSITTTITTPHSAPHKLVQIQSPPATRRKRSATTSSAARPRIAEASGSATPSPAISKPPSSLPRPIAKKHQDDDPEREERLKSAADISIARQISVSRQQRQLLIPIKKASISSLNKTASPNFPSPSSSLNIGRVASPLGVVAAAGSPRTASPLSQNKIKEVRLRKGTNERLVPASANPSTPTLVVVSGGKTSEMERAWGGATAVSSPALSGESWVGLAVGSPDIGNRKSERVIVESVAAH